MAQRPVQGLEDSMQLWYSNSHENTKKKVPDKVLEGETQISLERSISQGSTITFTVKDPERILAKSGFYTKTNVADFELDDLWFRCCNFAKTQSDEYTLEAEDREVAMMRGYKGPFKQSAGQRVNPRALFIRSLVRKSIPHAHFFCPELNIKPKVLPAKESEAHKKKTFAKGSSAKDWKINGKTVDPDQHQNIETVLRVCDELKAEGNVRIAIICAGIVEGVFHTHDPANDGSGSDGVFQTVTSWDSKLNKFDTAQVAKYWLQHGFYSGPHGGGGGLKLAAKGLAPGVIAQEVEGSAYPDRYETHRKEAEDIIGNAGAKAASSGETEREYTPQRFFQLPINEASEGAEREGAFECSVAYAEEVLWRFFCSSGQMNFVSDKYLENSKPRMTFDEGTAGIDDIKWAIDRREKKNPAKIEVDARAGLWFAPPGTSVVIGRKQGSELHEGVWLVSTIKRNDITDSPVIITLERPKDPLAERANAKVKVSASKKESVSSTTPGKPDGAPTPDGGHNAGVAAKPEGDGTEQVRYNCGFIASKKFPYVYGGGHGLAFGASYGIDKFGTNIGKVGLDCSGAVSWALGAGKANMLDHPYDTIGLEYWGKPGEGQFFTVWVRSIPDGHTFIEFKPRAGKPREIFVAHRPGTIVGFSSESHAPSTGNWKPRHWPGC